MKNLFNYLLILFLCIITQFLILISSYTQTLPSMENVSMWYKILTSEFFTSINMFVFIPYVKLANQYMNPAQITLFTTLISSVTLIFSNHFMFISPTSYDDYISMIIMMIAMAVSAYKVFN